MSAPTRAAITGVHGYVPEHILTNADLAHQVATTDAWITTRTGIKERRILKGDAGSSVMGIAAVRGLLEKTGTDPHSIDLLIACTITPDCIMPATANLIAHAVGATQAFGYDLQAACSGFLYGLVTGAQFIENNKYQKVVVVGVDKMSSIVNYADRNTCVLFGDGAAAVLLEANPAGYGLVDSILRADGVGIPHLYQKRNPGGRPPEATEATYQLHQEGRVVYRFAVEKMTEAVCEIMQRNALQGDQLAFLVPHQANRRIIEAVLQRTGLRADQAMITLNRFGNTTNATIPLCLWQYEDRLKMGDSLVMVAFGAGFTWGAAYLTWAY
ncbi:MAG: beta-ketoacyl-ACP synthase III [Bacteroidota bacterium]